MSTSFINKSCLLILSALQFLIHHSAFSSSSEMKVLFIETSPPFSRATKHVRDLDFSPILLTYVRKHDPDCYDKWEIEMFDEVHDVNVHSLDDMWNLISSLNYNIRGIVSCYDDTILSSALLAEKLELPHPSIQGLKNAFYKDKVREILSVHGVHRPKYCSITLESLIKDPPLTFPFVIKPAHNTGAEGVYLCKSLKDYHLATKKIEKNQSTFSGLKIDKWLIEEYIEGDMYSMELLWNKSNTWGVLGTCKSFVNPDKSLCMDGFSFPSDIPINILNSVTQEVIQWVDYIGLKGNAIDVEFKLVNNHPLLIEINPRLGGGMLNRLAELALGSSPLEYIIAQACGVDRAMPEVTLQNTVSFADTFILSEGNKKITHVNTNNIVNPNLIEIILRPFPIKIVSEDQTFSNIIGHVITSGKNANEAMVNGKEIMKQIEIISENL